MGLELKVKFKKDTDFDILKKYGFNWEKYDLDNGTNWYKGDLTCYSKTGEIVYKKLNQEVFDTLIELLIAGVLEKENK